MKTTGALVAALVLSGCSYFKTSMPPPKWKPPEALSCETSTNPPIIDAVIGGLGVLGMVGLGSSSATRPPPPPASDIGLMAAMGGIVAVEAVAAIVGLYRTSACQHAMSERATFLEAERKRVTAEVQRTVEESQAERLKRMEEESRRSNEERAERVRIAEQQSQEIERAEAARLAAEELAIEQADRARAQAWDDFVSGKRPAAPVSNLQPTLVSALLDDWSANEVRAEETWQLKRVTVIGRVAKVFAGSDGPYFSIVSQGAKHGLAFGALFCAVPVEVARKLDPDTIVALDGVLTPSESLFARHAWQLAGCALLPRADQALRILCSKRPRAPECHR